MRHFSFHASIFPHERKEEEEKWRRKKKPEADEKRLWHGFVFSLSLSSPNSKTVKKNEISFSPLFFYVQSSMFASCSTPERKKESRGEK